MDMLRNLVLRVVVLPTARLKELILSARADSSLEEVNVGQNPLDFLPWDKKQTLEEIDGETQPINHKGRDPNRFFRIRNKSRVHQVCLDLSTII